MSPQRQRVVAEGSPTPLSDYLARHGLTAWGVGKKLRIDSSIIFRHARGISAPTLATAFVYQEQLGIDARLWAQVPVVRRSMEDRMDPDTLRKGRRQWMARQLRSNPEFRAKKRQHGKKSQLRAIQMVKEGKAYYTRSKAGFPSIRIKPEFKHPRWLNAD